MTTRLLIEVTRGPTAKPDECGECKKQDNFVSGDIRCSLFRKRLARHFTRKRCAACLDAERAAKENANGQ